MSEIDDIRRQMAQIRHDLHQDVSNVVGGVSEVVTEVSEVMDWRSIVRNYPFVITGAALAVGYLIVPRRAGGGPQAVPNQFISAPRRSPPPRGGSNSDLCPGRSTCSGRSRPRRPSHMPCS